MDVVVSIAFLLGLGSLLAFIVLWLLAKVKHSDKLKSRGHLLLVAALTLLVSSLLISFIYDMVPPDIETFETTVGYGESIPITELAEATDDRDGAVSVSITGVIPDTASVSSDSTSVSFDAPGDYTVTLSASDDHNNESTAQTVVHVVDLTAPVFTEISDSIEIEYGTTVGLSSLDRGDATIFAVAEDEVSETSIYISGVVPGSSHSGDSYSLDSSTVCFLLPGQYTVLVAAEDGSGNITTANVPVLVNDSVAPVFTDLADNLEVNYGETLSISDDSNEENALYAVAEDEVSDVTLSITDVQTASGETADDYTLSAESVCFSTPGSYTVTITAADDYGNASTATIAVKVVDAVAPELSGVQTEYYLADTESAPDYLSGVTATDEIDGDITDSIVLDALNVSYGVPGEYTITYHVSDAAGNKAEKSAAVTIKDTTPPVITLSTASLSLTAGDDAPDYSSLVSASDTTDGDLTTSVSVDDSAVDYSTPGTYEVTYTVSDSSGNASTKSATVTVKSKTTVIESTGSSSSETVYITDTGSKYHRDGCRYLSKSKHAISKSTAIAQGYEPCKVCKP
ncbi:MAG: DUF5011 domain-containing protein [Clostridiales bacterium]|nr:DUF5011 domain-containing protein [Clostridiales bacterium]